MKTFYYLLFSFLFVNVFCKNNASAQITLTGTFTYVDPGETYSYSVGGASACPTKYLVSTLDGTNTTNGTGSSTGAGPFSYKWDNKSGGDFSMNAVNTGDGCDAITAKIINNISHIYLQQVGSINVPGGEPLSCGTSPITLSVPVPNTSPSYNVTNTTQYVQIIYTWNIPNWGVNNVQTTTNQLSVTPNTSGSATISVSVKRNDAKVTTSTSRTVTRSLPTLSSVSLTNLLICNSSSTISVSATGTNADKYIWTPSANVRINGNTTPQTVAGAVNVGAIGSGTYTVQAYSTACNLNSNNSIINYVNYSLPTISGAGQYLFDGSSNMWKVYINTAIGATPAWSLVSGDASFSSTSAFDPYISSVNGGIVQVELTNSCGTSSAHSFTIPAEGASFMAYPNPAIDQITIEFKNTDSKEFIPKSATLISELSAEAVRSLDIQDAYKKKALKDGNKLEINVKNLPRGIYYLNIIPKEGSSQKGDKIRIMLE